MSENAANDELPAAVKRFVLHWGDMGNRWGLNRSVAQIHALLFVSERPLTAEEISSRLRIARSNVSNSIKELLAWKLIRKVPVEGSRREHFEAEGDMWDMVMQIVAMRKAREFDPAIDVLRQCLQDARGDRTMALSTWKRLSEMHDVAESVNNWYAQISRLPRSQIEPLLRMGTKAADLMTPLLKKE